MNALVLGGGGAKGAYEVGVWHALRDMGVEKTFGCVIGTSVGALNAALFAQGKLDQADEIWHTLLVEDVLPGNLGSGKALASQRGLERVLLEHLSLLPTDPSTYVCCSRVRGGDEEGSLFGLSLSETYVPEYICLNTKPQLEQVKYLLASAALPLAYDKVQIGGVDYRDGGMIEEHNFPFQKAVDLGYSRILAVPLEYGVTREISCGNSRILILHPSYSLGGLIDGTLDFDPQRADFRMRMGYQDTMSQRERVQQFCGYSNPIGSGAGNQSKDPWEQLRTSIHNWFK